MNKIKVKLVKKEALINARNNIDKIYSLLLDNESSGEWFDEFNGYDTYESKDYYFEYFEFINDPKSNDEKYKNSINVYNVIQNSDIPRHIITDYRFWLWFSLEIIYPYTYNKVKNTSKASLELAIFGGKTNSDLPNRRDLLRNYAAQLFFLVDFSVFKDSKEDRFFYTKILFNDFPTIKVFQQLIYRNIGDLENVRLSYLKFLYDCSKKFSLRPNDVQIRKTMKSISRIGSVKLIEAMESDDILYFLKNKESSIFKL
ncbi:hypothetical protein LD119_00654 [Mesoplasma sp. JKS002660]|uniref:DUF6339 family protein n=1 Tax=Mesoplasma whartonense TaxID=2878854 RepID=UPI002022A040|nr:DUF6339 family protein [Mesoplasma sp. JKS002660]MCL8213714.1 hypothetical protein [Mesoplasma sp. JKS002660]